MAYSMRYPKQSRRLKRRRLPSHPQKSTPSRITTDVLCKELAFETLRVNADIAHERSSTPYPLLGKEGTKGRSRGGPSLTFTPLLLLQLVRPGLSLFGRRKSFRHPDRRWLSHQIVVEELKHAQREVLLVLSLSQAVRLAVVC